MGTSIDPLKDIFGVSDDEKHALEVAASVIGAVSSVWGYVSTAINTATSVLKALGVLSDTDQMAEMRQYIDRLVQEFDGAVVSLDKEQSMRAVADQLESARTQLENLTEFAPEDAATPGIDAQWDGLRPIVLNNSLQAVNTLGNDAYWKRVFFPELTYQKWPPEETHPQPAVESNLGVPSGLVFDYRLTMPAYAEAIAIRLTILVAVVKDYRRVALPELTQMIDTLEKYFKQIRGGISEIMWEPSDSNDEAAAERGGPAPGVPPWVRGGALVGAVEIYSAADRVAPWPPDEFPRTNFPGKGSADPATIAEWYKFLIRYAVRNWVRFKQLYDLIGLNAAAEILVTLKRLAGVDPATLPDPDIDFAAPNVYTFKKIRGGEYSMKELARMMHDIGSVQWGAWPILNGATGEMVNPISMREMLRLLQTFRPQPYTSLREALQQ